MPSFLRDRPASTGAMLDIFGDAALLGAALRFEAALAEALADTGLIGAPDAAAIVAACATPPDIAALAEAAAHAGTLAIPLVALLRERVAEAAGPAAAKLVHRGATSQDLADTALMLQAKQGAALIHADAHRLAAALAALARVHADTTLLGRTLLQGALPITFGLKAATWLAGVNEARARFASECEAALRLQFGGAAGTLAGLDGRGLAVAENLAARLGLASALPPWHATRGGIAGLGCALAILTGVLGKIARDVALLAQGEVAEAFEPRLAGRGGSSAMAHKRNPTGCQVVLSAALRAPPLAATLVAGLPQEHERGLGGWQAEAPVLASLFELAHGALAALLPVIEGLDVQPARMAENLRAADVGTDTGEAASLVAHILRQPA